MQINFGGVNHDKKLLSGPAFRPGSGISGKWDDLIKRRVKRAALARCNAAGRSQARRTHSAPLDRKQAVKRRPRGSLGSRGRERHAAGRAIRKPGLYGIPGEKQLPYPPWKKGTEKICWRWCKNQIGPFPGFFDLQRPATASEAGLFAAPLAGAIWAGFRNRCEAGLFAAPRADPARACTTQHHAGRGLFAIRKAGRWRLCRQGRNNLPRSGPDCWRLSRCRAAYLVPILPAWADTMPGA